MVTFAQGLVRPFKSAVLRITLTRYTVLFFLGSFFLFLAQGLIQAILFNDDENAHSLVTAIMRSANVSTGRIPWLVEDGDHYNLRLCDHTPGSSADACEQVFQSGQNSTSPGLENATSEEPISLKGFGENVVNLTTILDPTKTTIIGVNISFTGNTSNPPFFLNETCTNVLLYPAQVLRNSRTEELALVASQFWLFGISVVALLCQSIPHLLAVLAMRIVSTGWSAFTIWRTSKIDQRFLGFVTGPGSACEIDLFSAYFTTRRSFQAPDLVLNAVALLMTGYLGWDLVLSFNTHTFKRVGPPPKIVTLYRYMLAVLVCLQLSMYLMITSMGLWADQLLHGAIAAVSSHTQIYLGLFIFTIVTFVPWMILGRHAVRRENKWMMSIFIFLTAFYIVSWSIMFYSEVYRWTWVQWPFFACLTICAFIVLVAGGVLAAICWFNFTKGLAHYLHVEEVLAESGFEHDAFTVDAESGTDRLGRSLSLRVTDQLEQKRSPSVLKRDTNWTFDDVETRRPSIYTVDLYTTDSFRAAKTVQPS